MNATGEVFVKICGLTDEAAVEAVARAGADAAGFVFAKSVRVVSPDFAADLAGRLPAGVLRVAVMLHPEPALWREVLAVFQPDVLQSDAADFDYLDVPATIRRWPVYREGDAPIAPSGSDSFVYEGRKSGTGETVDWAAAAGVARKGRMILAGGLDPDNVRDAIRGVRPWGVDTSSGVESSPGRKDPGRIAAFVAAAKSAGPN